MIWVEVGSSRLLDIWHLSLPQSILICHPSSSVKGASKSASRLDKERVEGTKGIRCAHSAPKG